jgi:hypothetical protein
MAVAGLALVAVALVLVALSSAAPVASGTDTLDRDLEPVIVAGDKVQALYGAPLDDLFVCRYTAGMWQQIQAQVDEVTASGDYTLFEDGYLDANDEIVFMAQDLGDQAPAGDPITGTLDVMTPWYEIEVEDPINPSNRAWAYVVRSSTMASAPSPDYVSFDEGTRRITAQAYTLGFTETHPTFEFLSLDGGGSDILDRNKIRADMKLGGGVLTEENLATPASDLVKDGLIRLILRDGKGFAYGSMVRWRVVIPTVLMANVDAVRFSTDFTPVVSGSMHYNAAVPGGVTVDGVPEAVPPTPLSSWWQLSTGDGTVVFAGDSSSIDGDKVNYYLDDSTFDAEDTGDGVSFGDIGVDVDVQGLVNPFQYPFAMYFLPGAQPNVGGVYASYLGAPLSVRPSIQGLPLKVYVPIVSAQ